jgi:hypothetical protein
MFGNFFYNEVLRKTVVSFGTLFNNFEIKRYNNAGTVVESINVPLSYGPTQKFISRIQQQAVLKKETQITLPRMSFEMQGMNYDPTRKLAPLKVAVTKKDNDSMYKQYMPVPYNISFELAIYTINQDDGLQIVEQILPFFQPQFTITLKLIAETDEKRDVPIVLNNINYQDQYRGNFEQREVIIWRLQFTAKTYLFGPVADTGVIKKTIASFYSDSNAAVARRERTYTTVPKATTDQDGDGDVDAADTALLTEIDNEDFGFSTTITDNPF